MKDSTKIRMLNTLFVISLGMTLGVGFWLVTDMVKHFFFS